MNAINQILLERPELIALAIFLLAFAVVRSTTKPQSLRRVIVGAASFLACTYFLYQARQIPYAPPLPRRDPLAGFLGDGLKTIWWFWGASLASEVLRLFASRGHTPLARYRLSQDLSVAGIYICALVGFTTFVLNLPLQGLLVTSGAVAVILGLALQSALGDVFYGIVLSLGKPYQLGDWISVENGAEGIVVEMNWRATHLLTDRQDITIVPNSVIAKARIVNSSFPSRVHGTCIRIPLAPQTSPHLAVRSLSDAALACRLVLRQPPPSVVVKNMSAEATMFEVTFFTAEVGVAHSAQTEVYERIFRALRVSGLTLGAMTAGGIAKISGDAPPPELQRLLDARSLFPRASADERLAITAALQRSDYEAGEIVLQQGAGVTGLLIVSAGVLSLSREAANLTDELARFGAGDAFGASELQLGAASPGTLMAIRKCTLYRLDRPAFQRYAQRYVWDEVHSPAAAVEAPKLAPAGEQRDWLSRQISRL